MKPIERPLGAARGRSISWVDKRQQSRGRIYMFEAGLFFRVSIRGMNDAETEGTCCRPEEPIEGSPVSFFKLMNGGVCKIGRYRTLGIIQT